jgi:hypothetical protein
MDNEATQCKKIDYLIVMLAFLDHKQTKTMLPLLFDDDQRKHAG